MAILDKRKILVEDIYNYDNDRYAKECLVLAKQCKTDVGFGAVFVKNNQILGRGRNRWATAEDRAIIPRTDYAIHAEQSAILDAILKGHDVRNGHVYVLGMCLLGQNKGKLTTRTERIFVCSKCPHVFMQYNISVHIPHVTGWMKLSAKEALEIGTKVANKGYWGNFVSNVSS
jgi:hypothetical protein